MSDREQIVSLIKEAELYRKQGLFENAEEKYIAALTLVENHERFSKDSKLIDGLKGKIKSVEDVLVAVEEATDTPELSEDVQDLIGKLFSFSQDDKTAAIEAAVALAKFGQYERALAEFQRLIKEGILPLSAGKNMLRCHLTSASPEVAIDQFKQWVSSSAFPQAELQSLRAFLENQLQGKGIEADLPQVAEAAPKTDETKEKEEEYLELSSISIQLESGPRKGEEVEFDVTFQSGNTASVIVRAAQKDLVAAFEPGQRLTEVRCFSPLAVFGSSGTVSGKSKISSGPRKGDFTVDISIDPI